MLILKVIILLLNNNTLNCNQLSILLTAFQIAYSKACHPINPIHTIIQVHLDVKSMITLAPAQMTWEFEGNSTLILPFNLFEHKNPSELFASGELEHIPPDVKSNYLKPHELNKEVTMAATRPVAPDLCPYDVSHFFLYTVYNEQKVACVYQSAIYHRNIFTFFMTYTRIPPARYC